MNYLKYTQYFYLAFALFFIYDAVITINAGDSPWFSVVLAVVGLFMFFFRRSFAKKFEDRNRNSGTKP